MRFILGLVMLCVACDRDWNSIERRRDQWIRSHPELRLKAEQCYSDGAASVCPLLVIDTMNSVKVIKLYCSSKSCVVGA